MNEQIRITPIRLVGAEGEQLGIVPTAQALERAREAGLDLVEVAADERPPVCRIIDYGKMRFKNSQKGNKATKVRKQKLKEIRVRPKTGEHDVDTKIAHARGAAGLGGAAGAGGIAAAPLAGVRGVGGAASPGA